MRLLRRTRARRRRAADALGAAGGAAGAPGTPGCWLTPLAPAAPPQAEMVWSAGPAAAAGTKSFYAGVTTPSPAARAPSPPPMIDGFGGAATPTPTPLSAAAVAAAELGGGPSSAAAGAAAAGGASGSCVRCWRRHEPAPLPKLIGGALGGVAPPPPRASVRIGVRAVPICRLVRSPTAEVACAALASALSLAASRPSLLAPHCRDFFVWAADAPPVANAKLAVLPKLITKETVEAISTEVAIQMRSPQPELVRAAARAAADVAAAAPGRADACVRGLLRLLSSGSEEIVAEAVSAVRTLLQAKVFGEQQPAVVATVAALLPSIALPRARASVLWCVGNHCEQLPLVAPDVLRTTLARFADEAPAVRLQALDLAARCAAHGLKKSSEMLSYALDLGKYDPDHDVRARAAGSPG